MISHITLGTNNLSLAIQYYDKVLALIGAKQIVKTDNVAFYQVPNTPTKLAISKPYDGHVATYGNGTMLALKVDSKLLVTEMYQLAISLNSTCEGEPGERNEGAYFGAYFRDLDGNKIAVFYRDDGEK